MFHHFSRRNQIILRLDPNRFRDGMSQMGGWRSFLSKPLNVCFKIISKNKIKTISIKCSQQLLKLWLSSFRWISSSFVSFPDDDSVSDGFLRLLFPFRMMISFRWISSSFVSFPDDDSVSDGFLRLLFPFRMMIQFQMDFFVFCFLSG